MGYLIAESYCWSCGILFSFNPDSVPSIPVEGIRQPLCRDCVEQANRLRSERGLALFRIAEDAYSPSSLT